MSTGVDKDRGKLIFFTSLLYFIEMKNKIVFFYRFFVIRIQKLVIMTPC
jgi:hypothetical protein